MLLTCLQSYVTPQHTCQVIFITENTFMEAKLLPVPVNCKCFELHGQLEVQHKDVCGFVESSSCFQGFVRSLQTAYIRWACSHWSSQHSQSKQGLIGQQGGGGFRAFGRDLLQLNAFNYRNLCTRKAKSKIFQTLKVHRFLQMTPLEYNWNTSF